MATCSAFSQDGMWTWMKGGDGFYEPGIFGVQGTGDDDNTPPNLYGAVVWTDLNGKFWLFGGLSSSSVFNTLWKYDPTVNQWIWMKGPDTYGGAAEYGIQGIPAPDNIPGARAYGCLAWIDSNNDLWLYGGYGIDGNGNYGVLADLWKYSITNNEWTWIDGATTANVAPLYGTFQVPAPNNTPGSRWETTANWTDAAGNLWLFGGWDYSDFPRGDLWKYDVSTGEWTWMSGSNLIFTLPVYGIQGVPSSSNQPGARNCYSAFKDPDGNFWLFGGIKYTLSEFLNDLWKFDLITLEWTWVSGTNVINSSGAAGASCESDVVFAPRSRGEDRANWSDNCGNMWLFGGSNYLNDYNDLWCYRIDSNDWTFVSGSLSAGIFGVYGTQGVADPANKPGARDGAPSWRDTSGNLWLFGGYGIYGIHNDLWKFTPDPDCPAISCLTQSQLPSSAIAASDTTVCEKFCIDFSDVSTNDPTSWKWLFTGGTPDSSVLQNPIGICYNNPGTFDVMLITCNQFGCDTALLQDFLTVYSTPSFPVISVNGNTLSCSPASTYQWQLNSVNIPGATSQTYIASVNGFYTVVITDEHGCQNSSSIDLFVTGIVAPSAYPIISIYPNPSEGDFTIALKNLNGEFIRIEIFNVAGELIYSSEEVPPHNDFKKQISLNVPGAYTVDCLTSSAKSTYRLVVLK